jgi:hypothetical protein
MSEKQNRAIDRIVRLDVNNFDGSLSERWKAPVSDKSIGVKMIERILSLFGIELSEVRRQENKEMDEEKRLQRELFKKV